MSSTIIELMYLLLKASVMAICLSTNLAVIHVFREEELQLEKKRQLKNSERERIHREILK